MKKTLLILSLLALIIAASTSCNSSKVVAKIKEHCPNSKIEKLPNGQYKATLKCVNLYPTEELKKYASEGRIFYDWRNAELYAVVTSADSIPDIAFILKKIGKAVKKQKQ